MTDEVLKLKEIAEEARYKYTIGALSREEAKEDIQPYLDAVNKKAKELAKKYNQKYKEIKFNSFVR